MKNRLIKKLRSRAGETIGETLVALLISSFALMMLAGAISTSAHLVLNSSARMAEYYEGDAAMVERSSSDGELVMTLNATNGGAPSQIFNVTCYRNSAYSSVAVVSYVPNAADGDNGLSIEPELP